MTNAVGASGAINMMKCKSVTNERMEIWTDRREGENSGLDFKSGFKTFLNSINLWLGQFYWAN